MRKFKTRHYEQRYINAIQMTDGIVSVYGRARIFNILLQEEQQWLADMGSEYEEVMHAQAAVEEARHGSD